MPNLPSALPSKEDLPKAAEAAGTYRDQHGVEVPRPAKYGLDFRIYDDPEEWESELRCRHKEGANVPNTFYVFSRIED